VSPGKKRTMAGNLLMAIAVLALAACAPREQLSTTGGPLLPTLQVSTSANEVGFLLQVMNTTEAPVELNFTTGQSFDFVVLDGQREVWRWSHDQMFTQALRRETLEPGASLRFEASWRPAPGLTGEFEAIGILTATDHRLEQPATFRLP
jgi:hypothetical protein